MTDDHKLSKPAFTRLMNRLAVALDKAFNGEAKGTDRKTGFVLLVFPFNEIEEGGQGRCDYISNGANRKDIVLLMKEMIKHFEGQSEIKGKA